MDASLVRGLWSFPERSAQLASPRPWHGLPWSSGASSAPGIPRGTLGGWSWVVFCFDPRGQHRGWCPSPAPHAPVPGLVWAPDLFSHSSVSVNRPLSSAPPSPQGQPHPTAPIHTTPDASTGPAALSPGFCFPARLPPGSRLTASALPPASTRVALSSPCLNLRPPQHLESKCLLQPCPPGPALAWP